MPLKIVSARISAMPVQLFDSMPVVWVIYEGQSGEVKLFEYYPDELDFYAHEFIGLTEAEGRHLKYMKDVAYLQGGARGSVHF